MHCGSSTMQCWRINQRSSKQIANKDFQPLNFNLILSDLNKHRVYRIIRQQAGRHCRLAEFNLHMREIFLDIRSTRNCQQRITKAERKTSANRHAELACYVRGDPTYSSSCYIRIYIIIYNNIYCNLITKFLFYSTTVKQEISASN